MKTQRGQSTVELVLLMPLLLVMFFLIFEIGRLFGSWLLVTNAANEGARYGAVQCVPGFVPNCTDPSRSIRDHVHETASFIAVDPTQCPAAPLPASCVSVNWTPDGGSVVVTVAYQVLTLMPITGYVPFIGTINYPGYVQLITSSTMNAEQ